MVFTNRTLHKWPFYILLAGLAARIIWILISYQTLGMQGFFETDTKSYTTVADNLLAGRGYVSQLPDGSYFPEVSRTPGYPLIIAAAKSIAGGGWEWLLLLFQAVGDAFIAFCLVRLMFRFERYAAGIAAGLYYALNPTAFFSVASFMTETVFTFFLFMGVYFAYKAVMDANRRNVSSIAAGLFWGYATLVRPVALYPLAAVFVLFLLWIVFGKYLFKKVFAQISLKLNYRIVIPFVIFLIISGGWVVRNGVVSNYWSISAIDYVNLLFYRAAAVEAVQSDSEVDEIVEQYIERYNLERKRDYSAEGLQRGIELKSEAARIIKGNPLTYMRVAFWGAMRLMFGDHETYISFFIGERAAPYASLLYSIIMLGVWACAFYGVYRQPQLLPEAVLTFFIIGVSAGWESYARFRVPIEPYIALAFGAGITTIVSKLNKLKAGEIKE